MNKTLLVIVAGSSLLAPVVAQAAPTLYGKFYINLESQEDEIGIGFKNPGDRYWKFQDSNNASRLGVKGSEELGVGDLKAIYKLEYGIDPDGSEGETFSERNIFVGLQGGFGTIQFGKFDTPVKEAGSAVDQFNDESIGDITKLLSGETRAGSLIQYSSPKLADMFDVVLAVQPGENRVASDDVGDTEKGIADTVYAGVGYTSDLFDANLVYASNEQVGKLAVDGTTLGADILRLTGVVKLGELQIGALVQTAEGIDQTQADGTKVGGDLKDTSWLLSAGYTINAWKLKGQYGQTDGDASDRTRSELALGVDYKVSKSTTTQLYYVDYSQEQDGSDDLNTDAVGVALIYNF